MKMMHVMSTVLASTAIGAMLFAAGCAKSGDETATSPATEVAQESGDHGDGEADDHGGWWCSEHGVPEKDCSVCSSTAAAKFKEKGDWCEEHGRAESQCFKCDPKRAEKFAKLYRAKFGQEPPAPKE